MEKTLAGRTALVTGSTSGIGLGIARVLAEAGAKVMLNGFGKPEEIAAARAQIGALMGVAEAPYSAADLSKPAATKQMVAEAEAALGALDILVNNAGIQFVAPIDEFPDEKFEAIMAINFSSSWYAIKAALPGMKRRNWGRIINIASVHGLVGSAEKSAYVAAKHGIVGLTKVCALENATSGVTCNAICPGWVLTPLVQKQVDAKAAALGVSNEEAKRLLLAEKEPSLQFTTPEELGALAVFLCSDAASQITGANISMDGGWTAA
jgi:3-hydroxybutyrate dehydrogenase